MTGVSAQRRALRRARAERGRRPRARPPRPVLGAARRGRSTAPPSAGCSCCSTHDMALAAYHLPLDGHLEHGNNALLADGARAARRGSRSRSTSARRSASPGALRRRRHRAGRARRARARALTGREPLAFDRRPRPRAHASGSSPAAGADYLEDAIAAGLDAFLTGEPIERAMARARGGRGPLPRGRPLRHRDVRRAPARRPARRALRGPPRVRRRPESDLIRIGA